MFKHAIRGHEEFVKELSRGMDIEKQLVHKLRPFVCHGGAENAVVELPTATALRHGGKEEGRGENEGGLRFE